MSAFFVGCGPASSIPHTLDLDGPGILFPTAFATFDGPQAVGFYSEGHLASADALPTDGEGFVKVFASRDRKYCTTDLKSIFMAAAASLHRAFPQGERVQAGDIASFHGGSLSGHASHQNGLDMDIAYLRVNHHEIPPNHDGFDETFVNHSKLTANFDLIRNWKFISLLISTKRVNRIFVDGAVKRAFCDLAKQLGLDTEKSELLRRVQIWPAHDNHMHLRITCPKASTQCQAQADPDPGSACNEAFSLRPQAQESFED